MPAFLAPPLSTAQVGSFARETLLTRLPEIGRRTLAEGRFDFQAASRLQELFASLPGGGIRSLMDTQAPDWSAWNTWVEFYAGQSWQETPFFFCEMYFYRRLLEASGYFSAGPGARQDPFAPQKRLALNEACLALDSYFAGPPAPDLSSLLHLVLWGNQADLSLWPSGSERPASGAAERLLSDQASEAAAALTANPGGTVEIILDNVGAELACDLLLADELLGSGRARCVRLWAKIHPTFVSDAIEADITQTLDHLVGCGQETTRHLAGRLVEARQCGSLQIASHLFWTSPLPGWEMPASLRQEMAGASLVISKGDANYRRWLGDRQWPFDLALKKVLDYLPAPLLLLRVMKSELAAGLRTEQIARLAADEPRWMINGRWGLIQFMPATDQYH